MTRRAGGAFGTTVMCQCCQDSETCFRAGHAVDGPGNVQCISREAMCGAMSIHVAVVPRGIRGNLIPCHWEIPTAQDGRKARHGEVEAKRDGHLAARGCSVWCLVWNPDATENFPIAAMDPLQAHCRRRPSSWESQEVGVLWARKQPNPNIWQQNEISIHFHTSKELNQESKTFDLSDSHPMLSSPCSCSVSTESTPAPGAVGRRQALAKRQGGATTLALIAYHTKPSTIFFGTITATSQLRTPSPRPRQLDRCVPRHHRDRDTLLATTTINQHRRHAKHTQPNPQIKPHPPQQCLPSATRTPPAHPPLPPQKDHQC